MFKKNIKPILIAGALALSTAVSPVLANEDTNHRITINKDFTIDNGNTIINESFGYTVEYKGMYTYDGQDSLDKTTPHPTVYINGSSTTPGSFDFNSGSTNTTTTGTFKLTGSQTLGFDAGTCIPGVYTYEIYENPIADTSLKDYTIDSTHYTVYVTVKNGSSGKEIDNVQVRQTGTNNNKSNQIKFNNSLHEDKEDALSVKKEVKGSYGDTTRAFNFTGKITLPTDTVKDKTEYFGTKYNANNGKEGKVSIGANGEVSFSLKDGEYVDFGTLPIGTTYSFTETEAGTEGYTTTISGADSGNVSTGTAISTSAATGMVTDEMVSGSNTSDELQPSVDNVVFRNTKNSSPITGVIVNNMPYIALLGASGAGLVVLAASKKRSKK